MLRPRETKYLKLLSFDLEISPAAEVVWSHDVMGNAIAIATFETPSDELSILSRTTVDLSAPVWPVFALAASATYYPFLYSNYDWTDLGALAMPQYVDSAGRLSRWVERFVTTRPTETLSLLKDVANGVSSHIAYQSRESEGTQGPLETLDRGWGSCRDFAVLFADAARTLGFGARLVSGYLHGASGERPGLLGTGSTHAWVEVFVPGAGWIAFDPTNRSFGSANLIPVAVARQIEQISPVTGSFHGANTDPLSMIVSVKVDDT